MDKGKSAMPLLAIVAIVAVVAVVMVVLQGRTPSSEEAVAGEASKFRLPSQRYAVPLPTLEEAPAESRCTAFSVPNNTDLLSGEELCAQHGRTCIFMEKRLAGSTNPFDPYYTIDCAQRELTAQYVCCRLS